MLLFFCGMFIMVEAAVELGLMRKIAALITFIIQTAPVSAQKVRWNHGTNVTSVNQ